jgi:hypothetical protein
MCTTLDGKRANENAPSLLDAISAESSSILVDYPLDALEARFIECWKEKNKVRQVVGVTSSLKPGRYTNLNAQDTNSATDTKKTQDNTCALLEMLPPPPATYPPPSQPPLINSPSHSPFGKSYRGSPLPSNKPTSPDKPSVATPKIQLTMLQYYLFLFFRYPLLETKSSTSTPYGRSTVKGGNMYNYLWNTYLTYYLPVGTDNQQLLSPPSTLVVRLLCEFWLCHNFIPTTERGIALSRVVNPTTLRDCLEISRVDNFRTLPLSIQNGIGMTIRHVVGDWSLGERTRVVSEKMKERQKEEREGTASSYESQTFKCLSPVMELMQPSLLNYIRVGLACGRTDIKDSSFYRALEVWLLYLEPWNFVKKRRTVSNPSSARSNPRDLLRGSTKTEFTSQYLKPKSTSKTRYHWQWEAYVVSNAHFYVLPLAIFLRRARELEFSSCAEFPRSVELVLRVLRCYPPPIVNVLNGVLHGRGDAITTELVSCHVERLGAYAPPEDWKLSSCQLDAMNLLEEMFGQYEKRVRSRNFVDRWVTNLENLFSGSMHTEEGSLQMVLTQLKCLVGLPLEYSVPTEGSSVDYSRGFLSTFFSSSSVTQVDLVGPDRTPDGLLTDLGREQISKGVRKCSPFDVHYIGDPMLAPYQSCEIPALVDLAIVASNYVNDKLGLVPLSSLDVKEEGEDMLSKNIREMKQYNQIVFRINLRFLADYRNMLVISFVIWIVRKLL